MSRKLFFVFNPFSGKAQVKSRLFEIVDTFVKGGYEVRVHPTQRAGDAALRAEEAAGWADVIVCCGGDGTLDETVSGVIRSGRDIPLGYIPAGSTNDFASSLNISRDMAEAAKQIVGGDICRLDLGSFNERTFVYVAAFGVFTAVSYQTDQNMKNMLGHMAYLLEGARQILDIQTYQLHIESDSESFDGEFIYGMVTNSMSVGGFKNLTGRNVAMDDGFFEVTLIRAPKNAIELGEIVSCLLTQEDTSNLIETFKTRKLIVESEKPLDWTLDGENGGAPLRAEIMNHKQQLPIYLAPEETENLPLKETVLQTPPEA